MEKKMLKKSPEWGKGAIERRVSKGSSQVQPFLSRILRNSKDEKKKGEERVLRGG